jgi:hypothetical protein
MGLLDSSLAPLSRGHRASPRHAFMRAHAMCDGLDQVETTWANTGATHWMPLTKRTCCLSLALLQCSRSTGSRKSHSPVVEDSTATWHSDSSGVGTSATSMETVQRCEARPLRFARRIFVNNNTG